MFLKPPVCFKKCNFVKVHLSGWTRVQSHELEFMLLQRAKHFLTKRTLEFMFWTSGLCFGINNSFQENSVELEFVTYRLEFMNWATYVFRWTPDGFHDKRLNSSSYMQARVHAWSKIPNLRHVPQTSGLSPNRDNTSDLHRGWTRA